jgi:glycosyltransferase involved in cell wall biosynthesis
MSQRERPLRLLHLWAGNLYGGVETFLLTLARCRLLAPSMEPHFGLCFEGRLSDELRESGAPVHLLGAVRLSRPWTVWGARRRLRELLNERGFDAVCCHGCWPHSAFAPAVRSERRPLVFWAHDVPTGRGLIEGCAKRTPPDLALANSRFTRSALPTLFPNAPAETLYLPVPRPEVPDRVRSRRRLRDEMGTPEDAAVVVLACRLERWKGHAELLEALGKLREHPGWACWIAGGPQRPQESEYLGQLERRVRELDLEERVRFLGHRTDIARVLAAADVHCQPNTSPEPFGVAFVEALYAGLPVVTTALGGALEIVDETCGRLTPPENAGALAEELGRLIRDEALRRTLGAAGPARAAALCDPARQLARLADLLNRVVLRRMDGAPQDVGAAGDPPPAPVLRG